MEKHDGKRSFCGSRKDFACRLAWRCASGVAPFLSEGWLREALACIHAMTFKSPVEAIAKLGPHLTKPLQQEAINATHSLRDIHNRPTALVRLISYLSESLLPDAFATACTITEEDGRGEVLKALAYRLAGVSYSTPYQPMLESLLPKVFATALEVQDAALRSETLQTLASRLTEFSRPALYRLWKQALPILANRNRGELLADICALQQMIVSLGGGIGRDCRRYPGCRPVVAVKVVAGEGNVGGNPVCQLTDYELRHLAAQLEPADRDQDLHCMRRIDTSGCH